MRETMTDGRPLSDRDLDFWGDLYVLGRLGERLGVSFEDFVRSPHEHLRRAGMEDAPERMEMGFLPLLPEQERVIDRLHARWDAEDRERVRSGGDAVVTFPGVQARI